MRKTSVCLAALFALSIAAASVSSAQTMPKPSAEMDKVKWMVGNWQCTGKMMASPMGPEHPTEATVAVEMALDRAWLLAHYREKKTAQNAMPVSGDEYWTYDNAEKMWDRIVVDSMGGFATGTAKGWEKGTITWSSDGMMGGQKMKFRDTYNKKSFKEISYVGEIGSADGKWTKGAEGTCKK